MNSYFQRCKLWLNSLQARLMLSALLIIMLVLPSIGFILENAFSEQVQSSVRNELTAYSYSILAVAEVEQQQLIMPDALLDNQFSVNESGLYALISNSQNGDTLWASPSFLGVEQPKGLFMPALGESSFKPLQLAGKKHLDYSFTVSFTDALNDEYPYQLTLHIIKDLSEFDAMIKQFKYTLWWWMLLLTLVLVVVQFIWLSFTLKPFQSIEKELKQVEQGKAQTVKGSYPLELNRVANRMNTLLATEQNQRKRYRNALSNLAHSLKTPLAVIQTQDELSDTSQQQLSLINKTIEHQLKRAQSGGESAWHVGIKIKPIVTKLVTTLNKIYQSKQITIRCNVDQYAVFKGEEADLLEILGNLLDNASKAAKQQVVLKVSQNNTQLLLSIEDDGVGISPEQRQLILNRGTRADTYQEGHGIGLAIVRDLLASYKGELHISRSEQLGGAKFTIRFNL
ncbi:ATP-binding protein [Thalassotalea sp. 42_200_T64]|nr:ATP-binding protein [Thalassotalea sp. 42_200_T64]